MTLEKGIYFFQNEDLSLSYNVSDDLHCYVGENYYDYISWNNSGEVELGATAYLYYNNALVTANRKVEVRYTQDIDDYLFRNITNYSYFNYRVTYVTNGGSNVPIANNIITLPEELPVPTRENYTFYGWYYDSEFLHKAQDGDDLSGFDNEDVTLYARWQYARENLKVKLYKNTAENNRVDKTSYLNQIRDITGYLRNSTSILSPLFIIEDEYDFEIFECNYCYIEDFKRYYYITDIVSTNTNLIQLSLKCDVLMSYKDIILEQYAIIERQENDYNDYLVDDNVPTQNNDEITIVEVTTIDKMKSTFNDGNATPGYEDMNGVHYVLDLGGTN